MPSTIQRPVHRVKHPRRTVPLVVALGISLAATADLIAKPIAGVSLTAIALPIVALLIGWTALLSIVRHNSEKLIRSTSQQNGLLPLAFPLFLAWALFVSLLSGTLDTGVDSWQNLLSMFTLIAGIWALAISAPERQPDFLARGMMIASFVLAIAYGLIVATEGFGGTGLISRRSFALCAVLVIAFQIGQWSTLTMFQRLPVLLLVGEIAVSGSRTGLAVAFVLLAVSSLSRSSRVWPTLLRLAGGAAAFVLLAIFWPPLRERFVSGDVSVQIGGLSINGEGRTAFWVELWRVAQDHIVVGNGAAAAQRIVEATTGTLNQPHNEYLRALVDYGLVGVTLAAAATIAMAFRLWSLSKRDSEHRSLHISALATLMALLGMGATDNPLVYLYVVLPVACILGTSLSRDRFIVQPNAELPRRTNPPLLPGDTRRR